MNKAFGLDIGSTSIKSVSLKKVGNSTVLDSIIYAPSTVKGIVSESPLDQQALADTISQMLKNANIKNPNVNISIPESQVYTRIIEIPQLSEQELTAALKWEIEQYIPLPLEQVKTDWQVLEKFDHEGKKTMNVLLVAAPVKLIEKYEKIMNFAHLTPDVIETEIISVHRALAPLAFSTSPSIIVHLGASTTNVAIVRNGIINMVFYISLGGVAITRALSSDLGIDINHAEDLKKAYGLTQDVFEGKIGKSLMPILQSIVGDIKKGMLLYKEKNNNEDVKQIILSGGTALLPGIDVYFTNMLGVQVVLGNCWEINSIQNVPDEIKTDATSYNVVVGLALRGI